MIKHSELSDLYKQVVEAAHRIELARRKWFETGYELYLADAKIAQVVYDYELMKYTKAIIKYRNMED